MSTAASILASTLVRVAKHGNRASSSTSGSADLLMAVQPRGARVEGVTAGNLHEVYAEGGRYAFLFAPVFHPGMRFAAPVRRALGFPTIFNLLGPLVNPVEGEIEARVVGVRGVGLGGGFAEALRLMGVRNGMVVCGREDLDEVSCAGRTVCWRLVERGGAGKGEREGREGEEVEVEKFEIEPADFGLRAHPLGEVAGGKLPKENAAILMRLLRGELVDGDPVLDYVLLNTAALFAVAGVCDAEEEGVVRETGPGGLRWKEGVRRARWAIESGEALKSLERYIEFTHR